MPEVSQSTLAQDGKRRVLGRSQSKKNSDVVNGKRRFTAQQMQNLVHLTKSQVADHIIRKAIHVVEVEGHDESMLWWIGEVKKTKVTM